MNQYNNDVEINLKPNPLKINNTFIGIFSIFTIVVLLISIIIINICNWKLLGFSLNNGETIFVYSLSSLFLLIALFITIVNCIFQKWMIKTFFVFVFFTIIFCCIIMLFSFILSIIGFAIGLPTILIYINYFLSIFSYVAEAIVVLSLIIDLILLILNKYLNI